MFRLFGNDQLDKSENLISSIFFYCDSITLTDASTVNQSWHAAIHAMFIRKTIYENILKKCDYFTHIHFEAFDINQLNGGLTNTTFKLTIHGNQYAVRLPGNKTENFINRKAEYHNASMATDKGINATIVYYDIEKGAQVTVFLENPISMTSTSIQTENNLHAAISSLLKIHQCGRPFATDIDIFKRNEEMLNIIALRPGEAFSTCQLISKRMEQIQTVIQSLNLAKVACHNDTTPTNFILSNDNMYIIDWEYSGNNYPIWDLVCLAMEAEFPQELIIKTLELYYGRCNQSLLNLFTVLMPVYELWVALWAGIQIANNNLVDGIEKIKALETSRLEGCQRLLDSPAFQQALDSLRETAVINKAIRMAESARLIFGIFEGDKRISLSQSQDIHSDRNLSM